MKKKSCLMLALMLVMVQVISLFTVMPISVGADGSAAHSIGIKKTTATIIIDGRADESVWQDANASEEFYIVSSYARDGFTGSFKALWSPVSGDDTQMNLYLLVTATGHDKAQPNNWMNALRVSVESADRANLFWTGMKKLNDIINNSSKPSMNGASNGSFSGKCQINAVNDIAGNGTVTYEFAYQMAKTDLFYFDVCVDGYGDASNQVEASWAGMTGSTINVPGRKGVGNVLETEAVGTPEKQYSMDVLKTEEIIIIDGKADEAVWANANVSDTFMKMNSFGSENFTGNFKALWAPVINDDTKINFYLFITASGHNTAQPNSWMNTLRVTIESADRADRFWTGMKKLNDQIINNANQPKLNGGQSGGYAGTFQAYAVNDIANSGTVTYEFCYQMNKTDLFYFDVCVGGYGDASNQVEASWAGMVGANHANAGQKGMAKILDTVVGGEVDDNAVINNPGASIRVDTETPEMSGIRFASSVDMEYYNSLIEKGATVTTGTIIVPTNSLTVKGIADEDFNKDALIAAGLVEDVHFYDIQNDGWIEGKEGTWYATLYDIQDFDRSFSAVGYVTYVLGGETVTVYGAYQANHARSIAQVAKTVMAIEENKGLDNSNEGDWNLLQEEILKGFFTKEA